MQDCLENGRLKFYSVRAAEETLNAKSMLT